MKKKLYIIVLLFACSLTGWAQTFFDVDGVRYLIEDDHAVVARQDKEQTGDIVIPASIEYNEVNYNVTRLMSPDEALSGGGGAFKECQITGITLPEGITEIPSATFQDCKQLSSVTILGAVTGIGEYAFFGCEALTTINLPDDVTEMGMYAFAESGLVEFNIPAGVTALNIGVLCNTRITYLEIPAAVTKLDRDCCATNKTDEEGMPLRRTVKMFQRDCRLINNEEGFPDRGCEFGDMTTIDLFVPAGSKALYQEYMPWMNMHSITEYGEATGEVLVPDQFHVTIDGIRYMLKNGEASVAIQPETLSGEVTIPEQVTYKDIDYPVTSVMGSYWSFWQGQNDTGWYVFNGAFGKTQVTKVTLPASIKTIERHAFNMAQQLQEVVLNEGVTEIGIHAFSFCPELTTVNIPSTVTHLPTGIFYECPKLTTLILAEGIKSMGSEALCNTGIETLTIPSTCTFFDSRALEIPNMKTLYMNVKEPTDIKALDYNDQPSTMNGGVFDDIYQEKIRERLSKADLIVPLGCAESYKKLTPWFYFRSITDKGNPYLKLNNSVFSAPDGTFTVTNTENEGEPEFEYHDGWYIDTYTHGLCLKDGTTVSFNTTGTSWVYVYLFSSNSNTVKLDGVEITNAEIGDDQSGTYSYRRYDRLVEGAGEHTITCNTYEGNQWPCMFLLQVKDAIGDYYHPKDDIVSIDGINYVLNETVNEQDETIRTATIARQNPNLSGDIIIPTKVSYAKTVLQDNELVTLESHDYDVTDMVGPSFELDGGRGNHETIDGAFQECQITSISLSANLTYIASGAFNGCQQLKNVILPEGITSLGAGAFANCASLEEIYLPETITDMNGWYIFGNCTNLKKVNIPKLVTSLGNGCFATSSIETFLIPENVTSIGTACFEQAKLKSIKICHESYSDESFSFPEDMFIDVSGITLIVPEGTKESLYSQVYPWKNFEDIIEYTDQHDEHQYNNYRVEFEEEADEEETPAASRSRLKKNGTDDAPITVGFTPSGVAPELPTEIEKDGKIYAVTYKESLAVMPANDVVLKVVLTPIGDITGINILQQEKSANVYDLRGNKVASDAAALKGLAKGIYIIGGRKVVIK